MASAAQVAAWLARSLNEESGDGFTCSSCKLTDQAVVDRRTRVDTRSSNKLHDNGSRRSIPQNPLPALKVVMVQLVAANQSVTALRNLRQMYLTSATEELHATSDLRC